MPTCMTKFLMLGMPLVDVIQASTEAAAASVGWADRVGTLGVGRVADITVLQLEPCDAQLECSFGQVILPPAPGMSNEGGSSPLLVPLPAVSWLWVPACGSLEPPRRGGGNAQKTGENGAKMGEI